jgi:hypothetical protein
MFACTNIFKKDSGMVFLNESEFIENKLYDRMGLHGVHGNEEKLHNFRVQVY